MRKAETTATCNTTDPTTVRLSIFFLLLFLLLQPQQLLLFVDSLSSTVEPGRISQNNISKQQQRVVIVGGGISGLTIAHVLQQQQQQQSSGQQRHQYQIQVLEAQPHIGGHVRSIQDPLYAVLKDDADVAQEENGQRRNINKHCWLNIGHATHMGMFINLRIMLQHFGLSEWPVGRGPNHQPGLFRMISVTTTTATDDNSSVSAAGGQTFQPPLQDILSWSSWWQAFIFYYDSYIDPTQRLDVYLKQKKQNFYSSRFLNILYWAMSTFEFDKERSPNNEMGEYALGTARALLITQVFFHFLLCDQFHGRLPAMIDTGLKNDLAKRIIIKKTTNFVAPFVSSSHREDKRGASTSEQQAVSKCFQDMTANVPLASYFTADYGSLMNKLAAGAGNVLTNTTVVRVIISKNKQQNKNDHYKNKNDILLVETSDGKQIEADAIVFTTHPNIIKKVLNPSDFPQHLQAFQGMDSDGAVGVRIVHANNLPFPYPPPPRGNDNTEDGGGTYYSAIANEKSLSLPPPPPILGIFDISELTTISMSTNANNDVVEHQQRQHQSEPPKEAGWLSIAYPVYRNSTRNRHQQFLDTMISKSSSSSSSSSSSYLDETIYPWTRATPSFIHSQRKIVELQGTNGIFITGQALTGVNKASELQVTNALNLCRDYFHACPPWKYFMSCPMLPDCNDVDAFRQASSAMQALGLAIKSLIGSFILTTVVARLGVEFFDKNPHSRTSSSTQNSIGS